MFFLIILTCWFYNKSTSVEETVWCWPGKKHHLNPYSITKKISFCITRPLWVNWTGLWVFLFWQITVISILSLTSRGVVGVLSLQMLAPYKYSSQTQDITVPADVLAPMVLGHQQSQWCWGSEISLILIFSGCPCFHITLWWCRSKWPMRSGEILWHFKCWY